MKFGKVVLVVAAILCFKELARVPWHGSPIDVFEPPGMDPDPWTIAIWGFLLALRALRVKDPPAPVVISGCFAAVVLIAESHGMVRINNSVMIPFALAAAICFLLWERIEKLWTRRADSGRTGGPNVK